MAAKKTSSAKPALSRQKVLVKALRLADKNGVDWLSMRKLADSLNVEAMSLYNHVQSKDDVIDGIVELVLKKFALPSKKDPWKLAMRNSAIATHGVLLKHPWAAYLLISRISVGEAMLRYADANFDCLHSAGFSYPMADHAWNAICNHLYGFTLTLVSSPIDTSDYSSVAEQYLPIVSSEQFPHLHSMMRLIMSGEHSGVNNFEFGLDLILDGLERQLRANR